MSLALRCLAISALSCSLMGQTAAAADTSPEAQIAKGRSMYVRYNCGACHGEKGEGPGKGKNLNPRPRDFTKGDFRFGNTDQDLFNVISDGAQVKSKDGAEGPRAHNFGGSPLIPGISEADRWALVKFIRSLKK